MAAARRYQGPVVTADAVCVRVAPGHLELLTIVREREPFAGQRALPGVYVNAGETIAEATRRCLASKAGVQLPPAHFRVTVEVYDSLDRDPRGHSLSVVSLLVAPAGNDNDAASLGRSDDWFAIGEVPQLAFDHDDIVATATAWLHSRLWQDAALLASLVGERPRTTATLVDIAEAVSGEAVDVSNLRRRAIASGLVEPTGAAARPAGRGRPSTTWRWVA